MTKTVVKISYSNAVVPEFDSSGRPDLLGWDAAMESHDSEEEVLAVFHDDDIASLCKPVIKEFFEDVDLNEMYQSDDVDLRFQKMPPPENRTIPETTTAWFWKEIVQDTSVFYDHELGEKDRDGEEYQWEDDELLHKQIPAMDDFLHFVKEEACQYVEYYRPRNMSDYFEMDYMLSNLTKMYELARMWYSRDPYNDNIYKIYPKEDDDA